MNAVVGSLQGALSLDVSDWTPAVSAARGDLSGLRSAFEALAQTVQTVGNKVRNVGLGLTGGVTLPLGLMARSAQKAGGDFEAAMNGVRAALSDLRVDQLQALGDQARNLGPQVGKSAVEAADGIASLGLAGMRTSTIINGGLASALKLAAANQADVSEAGALANDILVQFGLTAADLPPMVDRITGALDAGKFGFNDYRLAAAQAGAVAGSLGIEFDDFNTAIAALSPQFSSGSDAGTSFATMLRAIVAPTEDAKYAMEVLGKRIGVAGNLFLDAQGNMKPLGEQAEILRRALAGLSESSRGEALTKMFGGDGMRAAIALMQQGSDGIARLRSQIDQANAGSKLEILQQGDAAAAERLSAAADNLRISLSQGGLLAALTAVKNAVSGVMNGIAAAPPIVFKIASAFAVLAAAIGPLTLAMLGLAKIILLLRLGSLGPLALAISALINPIGTLITVMVRLGAAAVGVRLAGAALGSVAAFAGPIGALVTVVGLLVYALSQNVGASKGATDATTGLAKATDAYEEAANAASVATGKNREEALRNAAAKKVEAQQVIAATRAKLAEARADLARQQAAIRTADRASTAAPYADRKIEGVGRSILGNRLQDQTKADMAEFEKAIVAGEKRLADASAVLDASAGAATGGNMNLDFDKPEKTRGPSAAEQAARREEMRLEAQLEAARLRGDESSARRLQDQIAMNRQVAAYRDTELSLGDARKAAARDLGLIEAARRADVADQLADEKLRTEVQFAEILGNEQLAQTLRNQEEVKRRTTDYYRLTANYAEATRMAEEEVGRLEEARAKVRARWMADDRAHRDRDLAAARGASADDLRRMDAEIARRERVLELRSKGGLSEDDAMAQAQAEGLEAERARMTGSIRTFFGDGVRAAMDGNLKDFAKNWWKDRMAKGLEEALNSLSKLVERLFANVKIGGGAGGGGVGGILGAIGKLFGAGRALLPAGLTPTGGMPGVDANISGQLSALPGFATGGSFKVGGMAGIDRNVVSMRLSKGEMVDIRRPGQDAGPAGSAAPALHFDLRGAVVTQDLVDQMNLIGANAATAGALGGSQMAQRSSSRRARRQLY